MSSLIASVLLGYTYSEFELRPPAPAAG